MNLQTFFDDFCTIGEHFLNTLLLAGFHNFDDNFCPQCQDQNVWKQRPISIHENSNGEWGKSHSCNIFKYLCRIFYICLLAETYKSDYIIRSITKYLPKHAESKGIAIRNNPKQGLSSQLWHRCHSRGHGRRCHDCRWRHLPALLDLWCHWRWMLI